MYKHLLSFCLHPTYAKVPLAKGRVIEEENYIEVWEPGGVLLTKVRVHHN